MGRRDSVYQPFITKGGLDFTCKRYTGPLLPFEKHLIQLAGCSEEEYRYFVFKAAHKALIKPAEYDNIPEIYCTGTEWAIGLAIASLVLGVASSVAAFLLMPKPKAAPAAETVTQTQLDSLNGGNRFVPTYGFDTRVELANYGDPIPIVFGKYTDNSGGVLVSPRLVWSRMFSYGTQQGVKLMFVVGEQGVDAGQTPQGLDNPDLSGIFVGNGALDVIYQNLFAFYWKRNTTISGFKRIQAVNLLPGYGTRGSLASGDPETDNDIFSCPTARSLNDYGFSAAHSLTNNQEFGCYSAIPNGTPYRVNWRVISIPALLNQRDDPGEVSTYERIKIAGDDNGTGLERGVDDGGRFPDVRGLGMKGTGRHYSRRMGITAHNDYKVSASVGSEERRAAIDDIITFTISSKRIPENFYIANVKINDINSAIDEECISADDALQIGEVFMIGRTSWQVTNRSLAQWKTGGTEDQKVTLKCIDINAPADNRIGIIAEEMLTKDYLWDDLPPQTGFNAFGAAFFPLMKASFGIVRNTRPCEVTEIGLKSKVFQRLNGLCNFQSIPTPGELINLDNQKVTVQSGTVSSYIRRASLFTIFLRPAGLDANGQAFTWQPLGEQFVVVGNQPVDQYNFIRIQHAEKRQYEFKFIPKNGADVGRHSPNDAIFWQLTSGASVGNSAERSILSDTYTVPGYGNFKVTAVGTKVRKDQIQQNVEFTSKPVLGSARTQRTYPQDVAINTLLPSEDTSGTIVLATTVNGYYTEPGSNYVEGRNGSFTYELFGSANNSPMPEGGIANKIYRHVIGNRWIEINYRYQKAALPAGHFSGQSYYWAILERTIHASSSNWGGYSTFNTTVSISGSNPFRNTSTGTLTAVGEQHQITSTGASPQGRAQALYEEWFGPARNHDYGFLTSATVDYTSGDKSIRIFIDAAVEDIPNHWTGLNKFWAIRGIKVFQDATGTTTNWNIGDKFAKNYTVSGSNPFRQPGSSVGAEFIVNSMAEFQIDPGLFTADRIFEQQSQYADVSFYGSLVEKSNDSSPEHIISYVNELTSNSSKPEYNNMTICGLSLKASRNFSSIDQLRVWLPNGIPVRRFHPDENATIAPSNLFCDLVYFLLTDNIAGVGSALNMTRDNAPLVNTDDLIKTAKFLKQNKIYFNGAITNLSNMRNYIAEIAPYMLCNSVIADGKYSVQPALPTTSGGDISTQPVAIKQLFTAGNILEDTFELQYLSAEERKDFQAVIRYREEVKNQLPQERNIIVRWKDEGAVDSPIESFDLTQFCTTRHHAELVGRYFLSLRKHVTHVVKFKTTPFGISLAPGDYIRVITESNPYSSARNGTIDSDGTIISVSNIIDGQYDILYYKSGSDDVIKGVMTVSGGIVADATLHDSLFTITDTTISQNIYQVEQLSLGEDNTVEVTAMDFPCDNNGISLVALDVTNPDTFAVDI